jgi:hypothetical protein
LKGTHDYVSSFEILKNNNYEIKLLEECDNEIQMCEREDYYIINFPCVNKYRARVPGRTRKEYREANKEKISEYNKEYHEANRKQILEKKKQKYICACGSTLTIRHKARHERSIKHQNYLKSL